jgi:hypothetical protein
VHVSIFRLRRSAFCPVDFSGKNYEFDIDFRANGLRFAGDRFLGSMTLKPALGLEIWLPEDQEVCEFGVFENLARLLLAYGMLLSGGVLLHSAGILVNGRAHLFAGQSGAGKSTLSRSALDAGLGVLSDDINAVIPGGNGYVATKLPFTGDLGRTETAAGKYPVAAVYRLKQAARSALRRCSPGEALSRLLACAPYVNADRHRMPLLMDNLQAILGGGLPYFEIECSLGGECLDLVH